LEEAKKSIIFKKIIDTFDDAELIDVKVDEEKDD
jgi:hypothetical protein